MKLDIFKLEKNNEEEDAELVRGAIVATGAGSYLEQIKYEGDEESIWSINDEISRLQWIEQMEDSMSLPSDSLKRPDSHHILSQEWEEAEATKQVLEDTQRNDKRLRTIAEEREKVKKETKSAE